MKDTKNKIGSDGLNIFQRSSKKAAIMMKKVGEDGLTQYQKNSIKSNTKKFKTGEDGLNSFQRSAYKATKTKKETINKTTGKTIFEEQFEKIMIKKLSNESSLPKSKRLRFKETDIFYQGSFELDFLNNFERSNLFNLI